MVQRRFPVGAELQPDGGTHFRVWAPKRRRVELVLERTPGPLQGTEYASFEMVPEEEGYFALYCAEAGEGTFYRFRVDSGLFPDPGSRYQPVGPHGASQVVDPFRYRWQDDAWQGLSRRGQVFYEMHVGTFTAEGTWLAAMEHLPALKELGVTALEIMPVAEFPGRFGWGYDGVDLFAPTRLYGQPDDLRAFVDHAHSLGLGIILDVVYNHFGPEGNYLKQYSDDYFTDRYVNEWGDALNFDGPNARPVRELILANARYWIDEFHIDGLRLDATQQMFDSSPVHIITEIGQTIRAAAGSRGTVVVAENEPQRSELVRPVEEGGMGLDYLWNDDFHHSVQVAVRGYNEAYYSEYLGNPQEMVSAVKYGYLYQGQRYFWQKRRRGTPTFGVDPECFVTFTQNHDQIANSARGHRFHLLTSPGRTKAATALLLLSPGTPMLFQGQEFGARSPFLYFADLNPDVAQLVRKGRVEFLKQFTNIASPEIMNTLDNPSAEETFLHSKLDMSQREQHREMWDLHADLLKLRREDTVFSNPRRGGVDGAVLGKEAFVLRFFGADGDDRLLIVNFGRDLRLHPAPEPLLAPPLDSFWEILWSTESPRYGGYGTPDLENDDNWRIPGHAAVVLAPSRYRSVQ